MSVVTPRFVVDNAVVGGFPAPTYAESLTPESQQEIQNLYSLFQGWLAVDHNPDGTHKDIRARNVFSSGSVTSMSAASDATSTRTESAPVPNATAYTLFDATVYGRYDVFAMILDAGPANFAAFATVMSDGTSARIVSNDGASLTLALSGNNVQVTQNSGATDNVRWGYVRIA